MSHQLLNPVLARIQTIIMVTITIAARMIATVIAITPTAIIMVTVMTIFTVLHLVLADKFI